MIISAAQINESIRNYNKAENSSAFTDFDIVHQHSSSYKIELTLSPSPIENLSFIDLNSMKFLEVRQFKAVINSECDTKDNFFTSTKNVWSLSSGIALFNITANEKTIAKFVDSLNTGRLPMVNLTIAIYKYTYTDVENNTQTLLFHHDNEGSANNQKDFPMKCYFENLSFSSDYSFTNKE
ncbi:TPA: hypothetical protein U2J54_001291 [Providencia rettgeri]|nr:hypothetical protein [Providencia rettgeri]HEM8269990.1 hypothetical protein [Providencia rettgeri]